METQPIQKSVRIKHKKIKPAMNNKDIINRIKAEGYKIKITHYRYFGKRLLKNADIRILLKAMKIMGTNIAQDIRDHGDWVMNFGGATEVEASKDEVKENIGGERSTFYSKVECSLSDPFSYSKGTRLALYRLINQLSGEDMILLRQEMKAAFLRHQLQQWNKVKWENVGKPTVEIPSLINPHDFRVVESFE